VEKTLQQSVLGNNVVRCALRFEEKERKTYSQEDKNTAVKVTTHTAHHSYFPKEASQIHPE